MRLGTWKFAALLAVISAAGPVVGIGSPAQSAERDRDHYRKADNAQPPAYFVAESGGRIVVVSARNGRIHRYLTAGKGRATDPAVSPDGRTVWFSRVEGRCAAHLASVPATGGKEETLPGSGEAGAERMPLPRPGRPHLAYVRHDCDKPRTSLIIGDLSGVQGFGLADLAPLAWNRTGDRLLARRPDTHETRVLEVNQRGAIVDSRPLQPKDPDGCRLEVFAFSPDDNEGFAAFRLCGPANEQGRRSVVLLRRDGSLRQTVVRISRGDAFFGRPVFDRRGQSLLFSTVSARAEDRQSADGAEITLWLWRNGDLRRLDRGNRYHQPVWLP